jgi:predicted DNA-binding transcriptional regulator AlpA
MTILCTGYQSKVLPGGKLQLTIDNAQTEPAEERLSIPQVADMLKLTRKSVYNLSTRKRHPLPLIRGRGRPYALRSRVNEWLQPVNSTKAAAAALLS